jgi:hypothetical protein
MGNGVLAYFGYPGAHEDDAERAVRAGLAVVDAVRRVRSPKLLQVRIGGDRGFESGSLQPGVCKLSVPRALPRSRKRQRAIGEPSSFWSTSCKTSNAGPNRLPGGFSGCWGDGSTDERGLSTSAGLGAQVIFAVFPVIQGWRR